MRRLAFLWVLFFCSDSHALGRLFSTEEQRQQLEFPDKYAQNPPPALADKTNTVLLNGFIKNGQGHKTVWINGNMHDKSATGIKPDELSAGQVLVDAMGRRIRLKPGQMLDLHQHQVTDVYDRPTELPVNVEEAPAANPENQLPALPLKTIP